MNTIHPKSTLIPFDRKQLTKRLESKKANRNDLINQPLITFSSNNLKYYENIGFIPKEYFEQIDKVLSDPDFKGRNIAKSTRYSGNLLYFGPSDFHDLKERCKNAKISITQLLDYEHVAFSTLSKYRKDRHIPSDLLEKLNTRLSMIERNNNAEPEVIVEEVPEETTVENPTVVKKEVKPEPKKFDSDLRKVIQSIKKVVHCNGEANLHLDNISERYDCDIETFVNSVFSLVSCENYVIFTTYNNGKPVFTLSEPM